MQANPPADTVEQTIEKLLDTVRDLRDLANRAINNVDGEERLHLREELLNITEKHNNQY